MPAQLDASSMTDSWTLDEISDVLAYAQTLPTEKAAATSAPTELPTTGGPRAACTAPRIGRCRFGPARFWVVSPQPATLSVEAFIHRFLQHVLP